MQYVRSVGRAGRATRVPDGASRAAIFDSRFLGGGAVVAELLLQGKVFDALQALLRTGIVSEVADDALFETTLNRTVEQICRGSPLAARFNKELIRKFLDQAGLPSLAERRELYQFANSDDYRAGRAAFLEKRSPVFTGT